MKRINLTTAAMALVVALIPTPGSAQAHYHGASDGNGPVLHVSTRWKECSIQLDGTLTQAAWRQFTEEAGLVAYFRPLVDAQPMGRGKFEVSLLQWQTNIDDNDAAWNDTFVHPDSVHWLFEGSGLKFPGLTVRAGLTNKTDVGVYYTKNPNANYGFFGGQVQQNFLGSATSDWAAATRLSFTSLFGPEDVEHTTIGWDVVASREFDLTDWATVSPYAGFSSYLSMSNEKSPVVDLENEYVGGSQAMVGAVVRLAGARLAMEYNAAKVNSISMKVGFGR
jgi:hypothetical protein